MWRIQFFALLLWDGDSKLFTIVETIYHGVFKTFPDDLVMTGKLIDLSERVCHWILSID